MAITALSSSKKLGLEGESICAKPIHVFEKHNPRSFHVDIVRLLDDVLCSLDNMGNLYTWHTSSGIVLGSYKLHKRAYAIVFELNEGILAALSGDKTICFLKHAKGCNIEHVRDIVVFDIDEISSMDEYGKMLSQLGENAQAEVWDSGSGGRTASFEIARGVDLVKISDDYIVCGLKCNGMMYVYANDGGYGLIGSLDVYGYFNLQKKKTYSYPDINGFTLMSSNVMMVVCWPGIVFVSLPSREIIACFEFEDSQTIQCGTILQDGLI